MTSVAHSFTLPLLRSEKIADETYSFYFDRSKLPFSFHPGQYIRLTLPHEHADSRGTSRFFTIASSPLQHDVLIITARIIQSSFKETFLGLQPGYEAHFFGPMGKFILSEEKKEEQVFLSGGIGITPFYSMLTYVAEKGIKEKFLLLASFTKQERVVYYDELMKLTKQHPNIRVVFTLSQTDNLWKGEVGRISKPLLQKHISNIKKPFYSLVGSTTMVNEMRVILSSLSVPTDHIRSEDFTGY